MKSRFRFTRFAAALALVAGLSIVPVALVTAGKDDHEEARRLLQRGEIQPIAKILEAVQRRIPGDVIEVELEREDGKWEYQVDVLATNGRLLKVTLDARTAAVLKVEDDD